MNTFAEWFVALNSAGADWFTRHLAGALISSLWEGAVLAVGIGFCLKVLTNATARLRFAVWAMAFAVLTVLPLLEAVVSSHAVRSTVSPADLRFVLDPRWSYALAALWSIAAAGRLTHLALQAIELRSLWRSAVPVADYLLPQISLGDVELCTSSQIDRPGVIGFFAPRILIPTWLFEQLSPGELEQIVLHELEHLRRRDDWINLLQKVGLVLFPLNPALFWIDRRLAVEREFACDDGVLGRTHAPRAYATCLTSLAELRLERRSRNRLTVLALGAVGAIRRSDFSRRIESILGFGRRATLSPASARAMTGLIVVGVLGGAMALVHAPQLVSFAAAPQQGPVAALSMPSQPAPLAQVPSARFESVVFHPTRAVDASSPSHVRRIRKPRRVATTMLSAPAIEAAPLYTQTTQRPGRQWTVLAAWEQSVQQSTQRDAQDAGQPISQQAARFIAPQPMIVTLPDGRTFLATYTTGADANLGQPGWLLIQL